MSKAPEPQVPTSSLHSVYGGTYGYLNYHLAGGLFSAVPIVEKQIWSIFSNRIKNMIV